MKATAVALLIVSAYWIEQGIVAFQQETTQAVIMITLGILLLPLAKYLWGKNLGGTRSSE
jgi:hypothetical protein